MRIAYTSDLHIDASPRNEAAGRHIAQHMRDQQADVVVLAGDASNTLEDLARVLSLFEGCGGTRLFVAGNHDVWSEDRDGRLIDSRAKYSRHIPDVCADHGFVDLAVSPWVEDRVGFVGTLGWYDYSFADPKLGLGEPDYWAGLWQGEKWWDREFIRWPDAGGSGDLRDNEICREMDDALASQLRAVSTRVDRVVAVVHTLCFVETLPRSEPPYYLDAFTGAARLGRTLAACDKVTHHIGGHKHLAGDWKVGRILSSRRPLGRIDANTDPAVAAKAAVGFIDL